MPTPGKKKLAVTQALWFVGVAGAAAGILVFLCAKGLIDLKTVYAALRGSVFTGFFTIGGFLLTLKNLILTSVRQGVYDKPAYKRAHLNSDRKDESLYVSLRNLGALIHYSVVGALVTSFAQLTIGLFNTQASAVIALSLAAGTATLLISCLWHLRSNLISWFDQLDDEWNEERKRLLAEQAK